MARPALSAHLSPDELKELAEKQVARAMQIETGPERLGMLTAADALINLAEIKKTLAGIRTTVTQLIQSPRRAGIR